MPRRRGNPDDPWGDEYEFPVPPPPLDPDDGPIKGGPYVDPVVPPPPAGGGGGGGGGSFDSPIFNFPDLPGFTPPDFVGPDAESVLKDPGYQFRLQSGTNALQNSAAAKGVTRTGGTLKDLIEYGQNFASNEYGDAYNRALQAFDRKYQGMHDSFAPRLMQYQTMSQAEIARAMAQFNNAHRGGGGGGYDPIEPPDQNWWAPYDEDSY